jgi:hypothetical protein
VSEEICNCGHSKSQHKAIVCGWWNCHCKQFEPLTAEPKRERKPFEQFPYAGDIISADVAAQEVEQLRSKLRAARKRSGDSNSFKMEITCWQIGLALKTTC